MDWGQDRGSISYIVLSVDKPFVELPRLAKSLRNFRDRLASESWQFDDLAFAGITDGEHLHVLVSYPGLAREQVQRRLRALSPGMLLADVQTAPELELSTHILAVAAARRRGLQPLRFVVLPRQDR